MDKGLPSLAMIMCVRDEEDFIGVNLHYHRTLGVSRAYIFADRCKDSTADIVRSFKWADLIDAPSDPSLPLAVYLKNCADQGLEIARRDGIDWLMFIDADEFVFADNPHLCAFQRLTHCLTKPKKLSPIDRGNIRILLKTVKRKSLQVILTPKEVIPLLYHGEKPFWRLHYFHHKGLQNRQTLDLLNQEVKPIPWLGHSMGKSIVRTSSNVQAAHSHRWTKRQNKAILDVIYLPSETKGFIYHFVFFSSNSWLRKYRKHSDFPERYINQGLIEFPKRSWKEICSNMSEEEAKEHYNKWIAMDPKEIKEYLADGTVTRETVVEDILRESGWGKHF